MNRVKTVSILTGRTTKSWCTPACVIILSTIMFVSHPLTSAQSTDLGGVGYVYIGGLHRNVIRVDDRGTTHTILSATDDQEYFGELAVSHRMHLATSSYRDLYGDTMRGDVRILNLKTSDELRRIDLERSESVVSLSYSPDGEFLAVLTAKHLAITEDTSTLHLYSHYTVAIYDHNYERIASVALPDDSSIPQRAWMPDRRAILFERRSEDAGVAEVETGLLELATGRMSVLYRRGITARRLFGIAPLCASVYEGTAIGIVRGRRYFVLEADGVEREVFSLDEAERISHVPHNSVRIDAPIYWLSSSKGVFPKISEGNTRWYMLELGITPTVNEIPLPLSETGAGQLVPLSEVEGVIDHPIMEFIEDTVNSQTANK